MSGIATKHGIENSEAAIFARLWDSDENMLSPELAGHVMKLSFSEQDKARIHELAAKNRSGRLSKQEREELDNFVRVSDLLAILQSRARQRLKPKSRKSQSRG